MGSRTRLWIAGLGCCAAGALWLLLPRACNNHRDGSAIQQSAPSATATPIQEDFRQAEGCACNGFTLSYRAVREEEDSTVRRDHRRFLIVEFLLERDGKKWQFKPANECALPKRFFANELRVGAACDTRHFVVAGPHWASAFAVGKESWTRRIDGDPSLPNDLARPLQSAAGLEPPRWAAPESVSPSKLRISCVPLPTDSGWVQVIDWGGQPRWFDFLLGRLR